MEDSNSSASSKKVRKTRLGSIYSVDEKKVNGSKSH